MGPWTKGTGSGEISVYSSIKKYTMSSNQIFELIVLNIRDIIPGLENEDIGRNSMLSPLGLDSIGRAELIEKTLEDLGLRAPRYEFHSATNLGELADLFARRVTSL
jgi:polyketide biosynthesis acyl carrier protein